MGTGSCWLYFPVQVPFNWTGNESMGVLLKSELDPVQDLECDQLLEQLVHLC